MLHSACHCISPPSGFGLVLEHLLYLVDSKRCQCVHEKILSSHRYYLVIYFLALGLADVRS
jgi:hypothetical protein